MRHKEADLQAAALIYVLRCLVEDDTYALRRLGLEPAALQALSRLPASDLVRLLDHAAVGPCLEIRLNSYAFWRQLERLEAARRTEDLIDQLLAAEAPRAMLEAQFGLSGSDYSRRRQRLGLAAAPAGRPPEPDEVTVATVWRAWRTLTDELAGGDLQPEHYLALHRTTGLSLRVIWSLTQQWLDSATPVALP